MDTRLLLEQMRYEHMERDGDPVRAVDSRAVVGHGGDELEEPALERALSIAWWLWLGFAVGGVVGAWMAPYGTWVGM